MKLTLKLSVLATCLIGVVSAYAEQPAANSEASTHAAINKLTKQLAAQAHEINVLKNEVKRIPEEKTSHKEGQHPQQSLATGGSVYGGSSVRIGPFNGDSPRYDGSELTVNNHSVNEDRQILHAQQAEDEALAKKQIQLPERPRLVFSGKVEGQASYSQHSVSSTTNYADQKTSDIDLTGVELDSLVEVSPWVTGFVAVNYDNSIPTTGASNRLNNSHLFVNKAFGIIGDLNKSPVYGSFGQLYVPFGQFSSGLVSAPATQLLGRTKARAITLNYYGSGDNGLIASAYAYKSYLSNSSNINEGGADLGLHFSDGSWSGKVVGSVISNLGDAESTFVGVPAGYKMKHGVPGGDIHASISTGPVSILAEYVRALRAYAPVDMSFNGLGAKPAALHTEADYSFNIGSKPSSLAFGYDNTRQALGFGLPHDRYSVAFNTSIWRDTVESLEVRHDIDYNSNVVAAGAGVSTSSGSGTGKTNNGVIAQMDVYF